MSRLLVRNSTSQAVEDLGTVASVTKKVSSWQKASLAEVLRKSVSKHKEL